MTTIRVIEMYRHPKSIVDAKRGKIPTPEGIAQAYQAGYESFQRHPDFHTRGLHSSLPRTELALDAYLLGVGVGTKEHFALLDHIDPPQTIQDRRSSLGDNEAMRYNLEHYDKGARDGENKQDAAYFQRLHAIGKSLADFILEEAITADVKKEGEVLIGHTPRIVAYGHEPTLSVSLIELMKQCLGHNGNDNPEAFRKVSGNSEYRTSEGTGYAIEIRIEDGSLHAFLVTNAGEFKLNIPEIGK